MLSRKNSVLFITIIIVILSLTGIIYGLNNTFEITEYLETLTNNNNLIFKHLFIMFIFFFSTISLLGIILIAIYIGFESISIGYIIGNFISTYKLKGFLYAITTILVNKGLYLLILCYLFVISIKYLRKYLLNLIGINKDYTATLFIPLIKKYLIVISILLLYDILLYFFGNMFLNYLTFML